jgi:hypothetical protein
LPILAILFRTFNFIAPKVLKLFGFPIFRGALNFISTFLLVCFSDHQPPRDKVVGDTELPDSYLLIVTVPISIYPKNVVTKVNIHCPETLKTCVLFMLFTIYVELNINY